MRPCKLAVDDDVAAWADEALVAHTKIILPKATIGACCRCPWFLALNDIGSNIKTKPQWRIFDQLVLWVLLVLWNQPSAQNPQACSAGCKHIHWDPHIPQESSRQGLSNAPFTFFVPWLEIDGPCSQSFQNARKNRKIHTVFSFNGKPRR